MALVLTRSVGESVVIGTGPDAVTVTIQKQHRSKGDVVLRFDAPDHISIDREEVRAAKALPTLPVCHLCGLPNPRGNHQACIAAEQARADLEDQ